MTDHDVPGYTGGILNMTGVRPGEGFAYDGRPSPYQACMFMAGVRHGDISGRASWEYVDGVHGDKTETDVMGSWSVYSGMLKKFADIRFYPVGSTSSR